MDLDNKTVVITGAGQGIGQIIAVTLIKSGARVALLDIGDLSATEKTCKMLSGEVKSYHCDVTDEDEVDATFAAIGRDFGSIDVLVNNAGILKDGMLVKRREGDTQVLGYDQFRDVMNVNVNGTFLCGRAAAKQMVERGVGGVIVNISSVSRAGNIGQTNYSASKAAVAAMTVVWAKELGRYGIRVGAIAPGVVETAMTDAMKPEAKERLTALVPVGKMASAAEIAEGVCFVIHNEYFSGRVLELDGGLRL
ncbi:SDR family NAD(P)-dependent oxidoreductase [Thaumasiovibrio sp. DFM-14]|uniref:SDR family NAD(P)-dependent oxidoreductase n=1 Tax=Thaumasiovibrio sp. DFM-14 TaxID=3384792 RepID=UPI0039A101B8